MEVRIRVKKEIISFKGSSEGVTLYIKGSEMDRIKKELEKKLKASMDFYKGMRFLGIVGKDLSPENILDLNLCLKYKYNMDIDLNEITQDIKEDYYRKRILEEEGAVKHSENQKQISKEYPTKFVYGTIRSGQVIDYNGNIVIIGDVNPGGLLKAKGNIIVLGALKGIAYAGLDGDENSIVAAFGLFPTQLRIANIIVRAPDGENWESKLPEVAKIINGKIFIEPYLPNK